MSQGVRIGLDLTPSRMTAVRISSGSKPVLEGAVVVAREHADEPFNDEDARRLASAMARSGCDGAEVIISAPVAHTLCAALELPRDVDPADAMSIAKIELVRGSKISPDAIECGWWDVPPPARAADGRHVLAIGLAHTHAEAIVELLSRAGIGVSAIETRPCAIARGLTPMVEQGCLVADIGDEHTLLFMTFEGSVLYSRVLTDVSLGSLYGRMSERAGLDTRACDLVLGEHAYSVMDVPGVRASVTQMYETLGAEVARSLAYAAHRYPSVSVNTVALTGRGATLPGLGARLSVGGSQSVIVRAADVCRISPSMRECATRTDLTCAIGLSIAKWSQRRSAA